ncbi:hypothetical protein B0H16DRAFT_1473969 [Mycena metata]|uniref:Uncharacterized protein n=1 Tax=Mycena metata TaxID=1033252 RepID=A0AAD7HJD2_9AGAR|nr:hypothetical protein B0H16DRAFT_1473969 [Mycena metata]
MWFIRVHENSEKLKKIRDLAPLGKWYSRTSMGRVERAQSSRGGVRNKLVSHAWENFKLTYGRDTEGGKLSKAMDMMTLVLFYTHAALGGGRRYPDAGRRITLPFILDALSQPSEAAFRGGIIGRTKLIPTSRTPASVFALPWVRFDGDVQRGSNDVTVAYGRLDFLFFASPRGTTTLVAIKRRCPN